MQTEQINAVFSEDMEEFLTSLGVLHEIKTGERKCFFCNQAVHLKNIQTVFPYNNDIQICCNSIKCHDTLSRKVNS